MKMPRSQHMELYDSLPIMTCDHGNSLECQDCSEIERAESENLIYAAVIAACLAMIILAQIYFRWTVMR